MNAAEASPSRGDILVVEDSRSALQYLSDILTEAGHRVRPATDGELALRSARAKAPDLVLLDVKLPGMDGIEVCRRLKAEPATAEPPVIFISAIGETDLKVAALEAGGVDYVTKPIHPPEVLLRIDTHLTLHWLRRRLESQTRKLLLEDEERQQLMEELADHRDRLEMVVAERTAQLRRELGRHQRTEELLRDERRRLWSIIEGTHAGTWEWNVQTGEMTFNDIWAEMVGYTLDELSPISIETWRALAHPDDLKRSHEILERHFLGELPHYESECRMRHKDGRWIWVHDRGRVITFTAEGKPLMMFGTHIDITERKRVEEENHHSRKVESLRRMAGSVAHHFNNQMQVVIGNLELVMDSASSGSEALPLVKEAMWAARKAAELSTMMLTYLGQSFGRREPMDLSALCRQCLPTLRGLLPDGVVLNTEIPDPGPVIDADSEQIQRILVNLVTNAWESLPQGRGLIHLSITTACPADIPVSHRFPVDWRPQCEYHALLEVRDTGHGIAEADIDKLFDPFYSTKFTGRGLGLPVVKGIVRAHGGTIIVNSEPGRGSRFQIFFPLSGEEGRRSSE